MEVDRRDEAVQGVESQPSTQLQSNDSSKEQVDTTIIEEKEPKEVADTVDKTLKRRLSNANSEQGENTVEQDTTENKTSNVEESPEAKRPRLVEDKEVKRRGQRMFGMLLGTLNKIKDQSQHKSEAEIKREKLEQKLQEKLKKEKEELAEKVKVEQESRKEKILAQRKIDERKRKSQLRENLKNHKTKLAGFLTTKTKPALYYLPAKPSGRHLDTISEQKKMVEEEFKKLEEQEMEQENLSHSENQPMEDVTAPEATTVAKEGDSNDDKPETTTSEKTAEEKPSSENPPNQTEQTTTSMDIETSELSTQ